MCTLAELLPVLAVVFYVFLILYYRPSQVLTVDGYVSPVIVSAVSIVIGVISIYLVKWLKL
jgi:hypothetical protein